MTDADSDARTCPSCGKEARGNFCQHCGSSLGGRFCTQCGHQLGPEAGFCSQCGASVADGGSDAPPPPTASKSAAGSRRSGPAGPETSASRRQAAAEVVGGNNLPWWIAGAALFGLILVVGWSMVRPSGPAAPAATSGSGGAAPPQATTDISQMTPREAADRLFNRVMTTISQGDTAGAMAFQPMAVQAYVRAEPLDRDGVFHQALLELMGDPGAALASAERILEEEPDHILALGVAANASISLERPEDAQAYYQQILDVFPEESSRALPEYEAHQVLVDDYLSQAESYLGG